MIELPKLPQASGYTETQLRAYGFACAFAALDAAYAAVCQNIKEGPLQGNGFDMQAERNGLILASNVIRSLQVTT